MASIGKVNVTVRVQDLASRQLHAFAHRKRFRCRLAQLVYNVGFALGDFIDPPGRHK